MKSVRVRLTTKLNLSPESPGNLEEFVNEMDCSFKLAPEDGRVTDDEMEHFEAAPGGAIVVHRVSFELLHGRDCDGAIAEMDYCFSSNTDDVTIVSSEIRDRELL